MSAGMLSTRRFAFASGTIRMTASLPAAMPFTASLPAKNPEISVMSRCRAIARMRAIRRRLRAGAGISPYRSIISSRTSSQSSVPPMLAIRL